MASPITVRKVRGSDPRLHILCIHPQTDTSKSDAHERMPMSLPWPRVMAPLPKVVRTSECPCLCHGPVPWPPKQHKRSVSVRFAIASEMLCVVLIDQLQTLVPAGRLGYTPTFVAHPAHRVVITELANDAKVTFVSGVDAAALV